ncbi:unnamed protein product [Pleuronectes platessa]|uniref:Uncharacterized protein n=1 Tax=Pleuronectes platessa TaxID=8262 RepID=A0A9N7VX91_PLEPL|nr:unnamed protein product [Pleuronectes platessa]
MMMMTVSSATLPSPTEFTPEDLLKQIHHEASELITNMSSEQENPNFETCWTEFFCLAEKALNSTSLDVMEKLTGLVVQYNKEKAKRSLHIVNCTDLEPHPTPLYHLVKEILNCS